MTEQKIAPAGAARPRFFYGYVILAAGFCTFIAYSGVRGVFGVFFNPMASEFGWSSVMMSGPWSLCVLMDGFLGMIMGRLGDRIGPRKILTISGCLVGAGYILMSRITSSWQMFLVFGILIGVGMGCVYVPIITNISHWFLARRNRINGVILSGMGVGTLLMPPIAERLISAYGWRTAYVILGIIFLIIIVVSAQFMRLDPAEVGQAPDNKPETEKQKKKQGDIQGFTLREAAHFRAFWLVTFNFFCFGFLSTMVSVHIVPNVVHLGISATTGATILSTIGGLNIAGRLLVGNLADRVGGKLAYFACFIIAAPVLFWLASIREVWMFYLFAVIFGFAFGGMNSVQAPIVANLFGLKSHGAIFGTSGMLATVGGCLGPVLGGFIFDITGIYQWVYVFCGVLAIAGIVSSFLLLRSRVEIKMRAVQDRAY